MSGRPSESEERELERDPLKIDLILERIFTFCDVPTLKNCRMVSTKWRNHSLRAWRDKAVIELGGYGQLQLGEFLELTNPENDDHLQLITHPFKRYSVEYSAPNKDSPNDGDDSYGEEEESRKTRHQRIATLVSESRARSVKIFCKYSPNYNDFHDEFLSILVTDSVESLEVTWHCAQWNQSVVNREPMNYTNIKRLKLHANLPLVSESGRSIWSYLLSSCPKLEALSIGFGWKGKEHQHGEYLHRCAADWLAISRQHLSDSRVTGDFLALKELQLTDLNTYKNEHKPSQYLTIHALAECKFPLEKLVINLAWENDREIVILPLVESCQDTLEYLSVSMAFSTSFVRSSRNRNGKFIPGNYWRHSEFGNGIRMGKLKEIRLVNGLEWAIFLLAHLETPKLDKLIVKYERDRNSGSDDRVGRLSVPFPRSTVYPSLETFELHDNASMPSGKTVVKFMKMMPNLVHLTIPVDKSNFPLICEKLQGLKTLKVLSARSNNYAELDDDALTGMSKSRDGENPKRRPNLTDLKHLTDLSICCQKQLQRFDVKFTQQSVVHGFLQLPRLYYLSVALNGVSDDTIRKLRSHVKGKLDLQELKPDPNSFLVEIVSEDDLSDADNEDDSEIDTDSD